MFVVVLWGFCFLFSFVGGLIHISYFGRHLFWCSGFLVTSPLGFKAKVLIRFAEVYVMYIP